MSTLRAFSKKFALPLWRWYAAGFVALAATNLITLEIPQLAKKIVNAFEAKSFTADLPNTALLIIALGFLTLMIRAISRVLIFWPGRKLEADSKAYFFDKLIHLPQGFFHRFGMGDLISRLANDIGQLRAFFAFGVLQFMNMIFLLGFTITKMLSVHMELTIICLLPLFLMLVIIRLTMSSMHRFSIENQQAIGRLTNRVTEAFVNVHVIQANAAETLFSERSEQENNDVFLTNMKLVYIRTLLFPLINSLMNISQVCVLFYGGYEVMQNRLTVGDILAFNVYLAYLAFPLSAIGIVISLYQRCQAAVIRLQDIESAKEESPSASTSDNARSGLANVLEIKNLTFSYPQVEDATPQRTAHFNIENLSIELTPGSHVGFYGPIGSGKSTLFNLITRLIDPPPGTIFFEGRDVLSYHPQELRRRIGYAQQTVYLFSDSIKANLELGMEGNVSEEELIEVTNGAQILGEINSFDDKFETQIGEKGLRLSGGQKQRLALARVFLRKPTLLLLDDVLSAVDHRTEKHLIDFIYRSNSTLMIASHRVSALKYCEQIIMLDQGKLVDQGTYKQLSDRHQDIFGDQEVSS